MWGGKKNSSNLKEGNAKLNHSCMSLRVGEQKGNDDRETVLGKAEK